MKSWVLDCSLVLASVLPDERSRAGDRIMDRILEDDSLWVPALWWYEVSNTLAVAQRRRRLTTADALHALELLNELPLHTDVHFGAEVVWRLQSIAREHGLSAYDAAYLELAQRRGIGLATLDRRLAGAARRLGVPRTGV